MQIIADVVIGLIALVHVYILVLEMFLWGRAVRVFALPREHWNNTWMKTMLKNQGLYNGFLAAGLGWGLLHPEPAVARQIKLFFLACVGVAGIYGAMSAQVRILFVQTAPALLAVGLLFLA